MTELTPTLLLVDDEPFNIEILIEYLEHSGYSFDTAEDGTRAWEKLQADPERYDVVLLDRMMNGLSGMDVLARMKQHPVLCSVPVILQTALAAREQVLEGLRAGAYHYLSKPFDQEMLLSVAATAVEDRMRFRRVREASSAAGRSLALLRSATFRFKTIHEARDLAGVLANACPDPNRAVIGLAELLLNAVEHGNLGIDYEEKSRLRSVGGWDEEIERRLADPVYAECKVEVDFSRETDVIRIRISDEGEGFAWQDYLDMDPTRLLHSHGRGIAMSRLMSFDTVEYRGCGNQVEVTIELPAD